MGWPRNFWCFAFFHPSGENTMRKYPIRHIPFIQFYHKTDHGVLAKVHSATNGRDHGWVHGSNETILDWLPSWSVESQQLVYLI